MSGPQYPGPDPNYPGGNPTPGPDLGKGAPAGPPGSYPPPQGSYPPPPPANAGQYGQPPATGAGTTAELGIRFGARVIDWLVVFIPVNAITFVLFWTAPWALALIVSFVLSFAGFAYFVFFETKQEGSTVGKKLLKLKVQGANGGLPTIDESVKRNSWMLLIVLTWLPFVGIIAILAWIGLVIAIAVTISSDPSNQGLHDKFAGGTTVIKTA